mmetsp:Transcript_27168/g.78056  ORF Transcript_27168/g.78056 Transcript_27168/m.78056 type:complete len:253 (-) Transcript_27168:650-1408(-)
MWQQRRGPSPNCEVGGDAVNGAPANLVQASIDTSLMQILHDLHQPLLVAVEPRQVGLQPRDLLPELRGHALESGPLRPGLVAVTPERSYSLVRRIDLRVRLLLHLFELRLCSLDVRPQQVILNPQAGGLRLGSSSSPIQRIQDVRRRCRVVAFELVDRRGQERIRRQKRALVFDAPPGGAPLRRLVQQLEDRQLGSARAKLSPKTLDLPSLLCDVVLQVPVPLRAAAGIINPLSLGGLADVLVQRRTYRNML